MMRLSTWSVGLLQRRHVRDAFDCGEPELNDFIQRYARQNQDENVGRTWVLTRDDDPKVFGFYALTVATVAREQFAADEMKRLPRYPVPVAHLGRLAVDESAKGQRLGEHLLMHALEQVHRVSQVIGIYAVEVRAKNAKAKRFYERYGFISLRDEPLHLYLSIKKIEALFAST